MSYKKIISILIILLASLSITSCQQSSEDSSVSANTDQTAPTTTVTVAGGCTLTGLTIDGCTTAPIPVTFTADETATIYYAQGTSPGVTVSTSSSSVTSGGSIDVTGTEGTIVYVAFFAQDTSGNSESSRELTITISDQTAPTTTVTVAGGCTLTGLTINGCSTSPIPVTFTADETATIYYAQGTSTGVSVDTSSSSVSSGDTINITGTEGTIVYVAFFAQDTAGNSETSRELTITIPDLTDPETAFSLTGGSCVDSGFQSDFVYYVCTGSTNVIVTITDNTATTIYYDVTSDSLVTATTLSNTYGTGISIDTHNSYLTYFARDAAGNEEAMQKYYFEIDGLSISGTSGGYYSSDQAFQFVLDASRDTPDGYYQLWYLEKSGTDASADSTADVDSVFTSGTSPTPNASGVEYLDTYPLSIDTTSDTITASTAADSTTIYQYKYNIIYDGTKDASGDIQNGSVDIENTLVLFIDKDKPKVMPIPPSSGSLNSTIQVTPHLLDLGHKLIDKYGTSNTNLFLATPQDFTEVQYCKPSTLYTNLTNFWNFCDANPQVLTNGQSLSIDQDIQLGVTGRDAAGNEQMQCFGGGFNQHTCIDSPFTTVPHFVETYTPGMLQTGYYNENDLPNWDAFVNFGHSVAVGDLDSDGTSDIIAIGAPAYSEGGSNTELGAVYVWYNGIRERALLTLIDNDVTTDVSNHVMVFKTDSMLALSVYLDPSDDASADPNPVYQAESDDYIEKTNATASEIVSVLNDAFLSSFGETYQNYLYADASTDGKLSIGHISQDLIGEFTYSSTFGPASGMYYSGSTIRAYDYVIYGENVGDEFGYSLAIDQVDTSTDAAYADSQLIAGAPGYGSNDGAVYVIRIPANDASADYGSVNLFDSTTDVHKFHALSGSGRLGHAIALFDTDSDGFSDIYTSAPYFSSAPYTENGTIYNIDQQVFTYDGASNDISADAASKYIWTGKTGPGDEADNALFGFSLAAGQVLHTGVPNSKYLFVGIPGTVDSPPSTQGRVAYLEIWAGFPVNSEQSLDGQTLGFFNNSDYDNTTPANNNFGYSLEIVGSGFESSSSKCPCLAVGAPLADGGLGKVWILGDGTYSKSKTGITTNDQLGTNLLAGILWSNDSLFMSGKGADNEGLIMIADKQLLTDNTNIIATLNTNIMTPLDGDNTGQALAIVSINGSKALLIGLAGESTPNERIGRIRIYSPARLTP